MVIQGYYTRLQQEQANFGLPSAPPVCPLSANPMGFGREEDLLLLLQRIRDEAHRFAISFHRARRKKIALQSALDEIPGVGQKRKAILLQHFKNVKNIQTAGIEEIRALPGFNHKVAEAVQKALSS